MVNISGRECFGYPYVYGHLGLAVPQGFSDFIPFPPNPIDRPAIGLSHGSARCTYQYLKNLHGMRRQ
jgi:hypothetical protein